MFLKMQRKLLKEDNTVEMKNILIEMEPATEETPQEERTTIYYNAIRKGVDILTWLNNKILILGGQDEIVDCKITEGEYNILMKSSELQVEKDNIYLL